MSEIVPVGPDEYAAIEAAFAHLLETERDFLLLQGEAILALEAAARSLGRPGRRVLNLVTGPYGSAFGDWFRQTRAEVDDLVVAFDRAATPAALAAALDRGGYELVCVVHAEAATGVVNPLAELSKLVADAGALLLVDCVASVGAEPLQIDRWGIDLAIVSAQKALAGPTGAAGVVVSPRAWERIEANPAAPRGSILSLLDWRERWLESGRRQLPVIPHHLETRMLGEALAAAAAEGLPAIIARHAAARDACRVGLRALGVEPWVESEQAAAAVTTTVRLPAAALDAAALLAAARRTGFARILSEAPAPLAQAALRVGHAGARARPEDVVSALVALGLGLRTLGLDADIGAAVEAALAAGSPTA
jgi:aspartate aminotransferase-like enzyme